MSRNTVLSLLRTNMPATLLPGPQWPEGIATCGAKPESAPRRMQAPALGFMTLPRLTPSKPTKAVEDPQPDPKGPISPKVLQGPAPAKAPPKEEAVLQILSEKEKGNPTEIRVPAPARRHWCWICQSPVS